MKYILSRFSLVYKIYKFIFTTDMYTTEIPTKIAPNNSLFDISDEESILDTSIQSGWYLNSLLLKNIIIIIIYSV